jgi:WD40 repeat protein
MLMAVAMDTPKPVQELNAAIPQGLAGLIMQLLAKNPTERPQSAKVVVEALMKIEQELASQRQPMATGEQRAQKMAPAPVGSRSRKWLLVATGVVLLVGGGLLVPQIVIRIKGRDGQITEIRAPAGAEVEVEKDGKVISRVQGKDNKDSPVPSVIRPETLPLKKGGPLSPAASVQRPTPLPGVQSWTIETREHRGTIYCAAFTPDGRFFGTGGEDGTIRLWNRGSGQLVRALLAHKANVSSLAWSRAGAMLTSGGSQFETLLLWDAETGRLVRVLDASLPTASGYLSWSPDGRTLACTQSNYVAIYDVATGKKLRQLKGHTGYVECHDWSPDSKTLATASRDRTVRLWDIATGGETGKLEGHTDEILAVAWSPSGNILASSGKDKHVRLWDPRTGTPKGSLEIPGPSCGLTWSVEKAVPPSPKVPVHVWEPEPGRFLRIALGSNNRHSLLSPDGNMVTYVDASGFGFQVVSSGNVAYSRRWGPSVRSKPAWSPNQGKIAAYDVGSPACLRIWETTTGKQLSSSQLTLYSFVGLAWSPDGTTLAASSRDRELMRLLPVGGDGPIVNIKDLKGSVWAEAWSPDSQTVAYICDDRTVRLCDRATARIIHTLEGHKEGRVLALAYSPDGKTLASGSGESVRIWDVATGQLMRALKTHAECLAWSIDGKSLAIGSSRTSATGPPSFEVWDVPTGRMTAVLKIPAGVVTWLPDGKRIAVCHGGAYSCSIVSVVNSQHTLTSWACEGSRAASFSADGRLLASAVAGALHLAETETGRPLGVLMALNANRSLAISPDGHYRGTPGIEAEFTYVVLTDRGQETLSPAEFAKKYGWKNDPERVRLTAR